MGCDIHCFMERKTESGWEQINDLDPFGERCYGIFGFLAGVRNYSAVKPISLPRGLPSDASDATVDEHKRMMPDAHSASWLSVDELSRFDYEAMTEDRRVTRGNDGGATCEPGKGKPQTYREFLGRWFFEDLAKLKSSDAERIVFWFDN